MKNSAVRIILVLSISSILLPITAGLEGVYAQATNATVLSGNDINSQPVQLQNQSVNYYGDLSGYLVQPITSNATAQLPAVVMIHEWWGLNDNIKDMANELASMGYVVLAADLYGEVTDDPNRARELSSSVRDNPDQAVENLQSAVQYVGSLPNVNSSRVASLGWCFGGGQSLQLALNSDENPLAATVLYYGNIDIDPNELAKIKWPVLGIFGDQDQSIPVDLVDQFGEALNQTGITNEIYLYPGVGHAFANPTGDNYAPEETNDAWEKTLAFLDKHV